MNILHVFPYLILFLYNFTIYVSHATGIKELKFIQFALLFYHLDLFFSQNVSCFLDIILVLFCTLYYIYAYILYLIYMNLQAY